MKNNDIKDIIEETIANEIKNIISESVSAEVYIIKNKEGEPIEQFETEEEANSALEEYKKKHPEQELIIEPGEKLSFEELDKMSEKIENMENINETQHKGSFTIDQVEKLAKKAGKTNKEAGEALDKLADKHYQQEEVHGAKVPASDVFAILDDHDMSELKSKIKAKKAGETKEETEPTEGNAFTAALAKAKESGDEKFTVDGKEYDVEECWGKQMEEEEECDECGGMEEEWNESETCEKCGKEICECGAMMNENKKTIRLNESELVTLITKIVNESFPGAETYNKVHKDGGKQNADALSDVEKKIKDYLNFDGNDNPEFPHQVGGEVKARRADEEESEEVADHRGGGMEDLIYDVDPSKEAQERHEMALKGDSKMGNSQDAANVVPSKLGEKIIKKVKRKDKEEENKVMYNKDVQPVKVVKESEDESKKIISEEIQRMKEMSSYNKKTQ